MTLYTVYVCMYIYVYVCVCVGTEIENNSR